MFNIGQKVKYYDRNVRGWVYAEVVGRGEKNGEVVYDVELANGDERWGYADQLKAR